MNVKDAEECIEEKMQKDNINDLKDAQI